MKERLDVMLVSRGLAQSREKAKAVIMAGIVYVDGQKEDKAGSVFGETASIEVRGQTLPYVSRGGLKLEKAMARFGLELEGKVCMDVGASTGGFTDCMLQNGASRVYSVDVGHGQLAWKLRNDPRVVCMEKTNIRYVTPNQIPEAVGFASIDVSFISLTKVLGPVRELMVPDGEVVCLIKPQFEAGREKVGKKGVVREKSTHLEVIRKILLFARESGYAPLGLEFSPIKGPEGNIEYLLHLRKRPDTGRSGNLAAGREEVEDLAAVREEAGDLAAGRDEAEDLAANRDEAGDLAAVREEAGDLAAGRDEAGDLAAGWEEAGSQEGADIDPEAVVEAAHGSL